MPDDIPKIPRHRGKKNRPKDTTWRQQTLPAYRPHLNVTSAIPVTLFLGTCILAIGIALYFGNMDSLEEVIDYTDCSLPNGTKVLDVQKKHVNGVLQCSYTIVLDREYDGDVKFYYGLTKFYQNNRLYFNSRNDEQLRGNLDKTADCEPLRVANLNDSIVPIAPCGFIANSMFNDTFQLFYITDPVKNGTVRVPWTARGVLGKREIEKKFRNPPRVGNQTLCDAFKGTVRPPSWQVDVCHLGNQSVDTTDQEAIGLGFENIDFMVWMKPAALPSFRKLYRNLDRQVDFFSNGLPAGNYTLVINYNYFVDAFDGTKSFVIARESWVGPRNLFLPVIYLVVGTFLLLVSALFILIFLKQRLSKVHP